MNRILKLFLVVFCLGFLAVSLFAQPPKPTPTSQVAVSSTTGKEAVCEGAGEIIPSGLQTFKRKRYFAAHPKPKNTLTKPRPRK